MQDDALLLQAIISDRDLSVETFADLIGDSPLRLYRVLEGEEPLGKCAMLALLAIENGLAPIDVDAA